MTRVLQCSRVLIVLLPSDVFPLLMLRFCSVTQAPSAAKWQKSSCTRSTQHAHAFEISIPPAMLSCIVMRDSALHSKRVFFVSAKFNDALPSTSTSDVSMRVRSASVSAAAYLAQVTVSLCVDVFVCGFWVF